MKVKVMVIAAIVLSSQATFAHEPRKGANGGTMVDAGSYHVELVSRGSTVDVFVSDASDKPVAATGFKATALLLVNGKPQRIALEPGEGNRLSGPAPAELPPNPKGAVQLTGSDGKTAQARFN